MTSFITPVLARAPQPMNARSQLERLMTALRASKPARPAALAWLGLQGLALWPHAHWAWQRLHDGSDDPLGLAALALLVALVIKQRDGLLQEPRMTFLWAAAASTVLATLALLWVPPLMAALLAATAMALSLAAWLPSTAPRAPMAGLVVLALPWMASLQFYAGYPLRVVTAQLSSWGLQLAGIDALRAGTTMTVRGQLVMVDAPCSGVQMVWLAYFTACAVAAIANVRDAAFLRRLPLIGVLVLLGNATRNAVLVALESRPEGLSSAAHEAVGLLVLAAVLSLVMVWMKPKRNHDEQAHA